MSHRKLKMKNQKLKIGGEKSGFLRNGQADSTLQSDSGRASSGQAVLLVVLSLGGALLGATAIAGFLTVIQLQQSGDVANSAKAIFAAEAGVNCALYDYANSSTAPCHSYTGTTLHLSNASFADFTCYKDDALTLTAACANPSSTYILSKGVAGTAKRALLFTITVPSGGP